MWSVRNANLPETSSRLFDADDLDDLVDDDENYQTNQGGRRPSSGLLSDSVRSSVIREEENPTSDEFFLSSRNIVMDDDDDGGKNTEDDNNDDNAIFVEETASSCTDDDDGVASNTNGNVSTMMMIPLNGDNAHHHDHDMEQKSTIIETTCEPPKPSSVLLENDNNTTNHLRRRRAAPPQRKDSFRSSNSDDDNSFLSKDTNDDGNKSYDRQHEQENMVKVKLNKDTFSFVVSAPCRSIPFWTGTLIFLLKVGVFSLIFSALIDSQEKSNPLRIPVSVSMIVVVGQFLAIFITVVLQDDLLTFFIMVFEGYAEELPTVFRGGAFWKWCMGTSCLAFAGLLGLTVTFFLIVSSSEVVELLLNFTAVEFVSLLDNVAFNLAEDGFLGAANREEAELVRATKYRIPAHRSRNNRNYFGFVAMVFIILMSAWSYVYILQLGGQFQPRTIHVQFDDSLVKGLGPASGEYHLDNRRHKWEYDRLRYRGNQGFFGYCSKRRAWTFSFSSNNNNDDPCRDFYASSAKTNTFDITKSNPADWSVVGRGSTRSFDMDFFLKIGCEKDDECGGKGIGGVCTWHNSCECEEDRYGLRCDYSEHNTCGQIELLSHDEPFAGSREYASEYSILRAPTDGKIVKVYDHPVYVSDLSKGTADIVFFEGVRWILVHSSIGLQNLTGVSEQGLADYFGHHSDDDFDANEHLLQVEFISEVVEFSSPRDAIDPSPAGLSWFLSHSSTTNDLEVVGKALASFICSFCSKQNPCLNGNACNSDGRCECTNGATGTLCQITPLNNGKCDVSFNTGTYKWDGSDCCEFTCVSTPEHSCGVLDANETGGIEHLHQGFPFCADPSSLCTGSGCWSTTSRSIPSGASGVPPTVLLSSNSRILVTTKSNLDILEVWDRDDSRWIQRGAFIEGPRGSLFGRLVALYTPPGSVMSRRFGKVPVIVAASADIGMNRTMQIFSWQPSDTAWHSLGTVTVCSDGCDTSSASIGWDGKIARLVVCLDDTRCSTFESLPQGGWSSQRIFAVHNFTYTMSNDATNLVALNEDRSLTFYDLTAPNSDFYETKLNYTALGGYHIYAMGFSLEGLHLTCIGERFRGDVAVGDTAQKYKREILFFRFKAKYELRILQLTQPFRFYLDDEVAIGEIEFSKDSSTVAVRYVSHNSSEVSIYTLRPGENSSDNAFRQIGESRLIPEDDNFRVSETGATLVVSNSDKTSFSAPLNKCSDSEMNFHLSISLNEHPGNVSWSVKSILRYKNTVFPVRVDKECDRCYKPLEDFFSRTRIKEEACIRRKEKDCVRLTFQSDAPLSDGSGYAFFFDGKKVFSHQGNATIPVVHSSGDSKELESCSVKEKTCGDDEVLFALILQLDSYPKETSWKLQSMDEFTLASVSKKEYETTELRVEQTCVPRNQTCFVLGVFDSWGDGTYRNGGYYEAYVGDTYLPRNYVYDSSRKHFIGPGCPAYRQCTQLPTFDESDNVTTFSLPSVSFHEESSINASLEAKELQIQDCDVNQVSCPSDMWPLAVGITFNKEGPHGLTWKLIEFYTGEVVAKSGNYFLVQDSSTVVHQTCVEPACYSFWIHDNEKQGIYGSEFNGYGGYSVSFAESFPQIDNRTGDFDREERIWYNCPELVNITVELHLDSYPRETGLLINNWQKSVRYFRYFLTTESNKAVNRTVELPIGQDYKIYLWDAKKDGITNGYYRIYLGPELLPDNSTRSILLAEGETFHTHNMTVNFTASWDNEYVGPSKEDHIMSENNTADRDGEQVEADTVAGNNTVTVSGNEDQSDMDSTTSNHTVGGVNVMDSMTNNQTDDGNEERRLLETLKSLQLLDGKPQDKMGLVAADFEYEHE